VPPAALKVASICRYVRLPLGRCELIMKWTISLFFGSIFLLVAGMNAIVFWRSTIRRKEAGSWVPLLGGVAGVTSLLTVPITNWSRLWWLPLVLDYGSIPGLVHALVVHLRYNPDGTRKS
jgi:hypothetical protein